MAYGGQSFGVPRGVSNDRKPGFASIPPSGIPPFPANAFTTAYNILPSEFPGGSVRTGFPSDGELIVVYSTGFPRSEGVSYDFRGGGPSPVENWNLTDVWANEGPGAFGMSGFSNVGDSDDPDEFLIAAQWNFAQRAVSVHDRATGATKSIPTAGSPLTNAQLYAVGIEGNARAWVGQIGGANSRTLYTPTTPGRRITRTRAERWACPLTVA